MPQTEPTIVAEFIEYAMKKSNQHLGPLITTCLALSAALGVAGVASCGIPFVAPAGQVAISLGVMGIITVITGIILAWPHGRHIRLLVVAFGVLLLILNGVAIWSGQLGKHLIDYMEGH